MAFNLEAPIKKEAAAQASSTAPIKQDVDLFLFGVIPVKTATVETIPKVMLAPCGTPFGVKILTDGVIVVGLNEISTENGSRNPAKEAGIRTGDIIIKLIILPYPLMQKLPKLLREAVANVLPYAINAGENKHSQPDAGSFRH